MLNVNMDSNQSTNTVRIEPRKSNESKTGADDDSITIPKEIKGFKRDSSKHIICLDCGKRFKAKNSYNYHKRM